MVNEIENEVNIKLLKNMLELQDKLNTKTCGDKWTLGMTTEGREINWKRYMRMELFELIDSSDKFKHWKNLDGGVDFENIKMEVVDVWHFLMSQALTELPINAIILMYCYSVLNDEYEAAKELDYFGIIDMADNMIESTYANGVGSMNDIFYNFFKLLASVGMSFGDLYKQYLVKNVLNTFRQNNGYKQGTYVKEIDGSEDNVHIMNMVTSNPSITPDELYKEYQVFYNNNTGKEL